MAYSSYQKVADQFLRLAYTNTPRPAFSSTETLYYGTLNSGASAEIVSNNLGNVILRVSGFPMAVRRQKDNRFIVKQAGIVQDMIYHGMLKALIKALEGNGYSYLAVPDIHDYQFT